MCGSVYEYRAAGQYSKDNEEITEHKVRSTRGQATTCCEACRLINALLPRGVHSYSLVAHPAVICLATDA